MLPAGTTQRGCEGGEGAAGRSGEDGSAGKPRFHPTKMQHINTCVSGQQRSFEMKHYSLNQQVGQVNSLD